ILKYIGSSKPIIAVNTHHHWDHVWGNAALKDSAIISHHLCREILDLEWEPVREKNRSFVDGEADKCLPNLVFDNEIYFPDDKIRIFHTPGHTADSISVLDEEDKVLNAGDNIGDTVDEIVPELECDISVYIKTLLKLKSVDFNTCISGHNTVLSKNVIDDILNLVQHE
ncbi:MAG: MBL fold metallo-hydrolase, partial [Eubacteriales bacterium]|nr:MBL fold metallo-hydrolase [Eubacteriales bacterium]